MTRKTKEKWIARVRDWRASGQSAAEFVVGKEYAETTLRWAASQVEGSVDVQGSREPDASLSGPHPDPRLVAVRVRPAEAVRELVIEVGNARIRVGRGVDLTLLGDVVHALQEAR